MSADGVPVRIGFVLHVMQVAGAEMLVAEIIRQLGSQLQPVVLCLDGVGQLGETMRREGVDVVELGRKPGVDFGVARRLAAEIRHRRLEVVHAHQYTPFFYTALARLLVSDPTHVIFTEHGRHYPDRVSLKRRLLNRTLLGRMADEVTGVCRFSAEGLDRDGFPLRRIQIVENGIQVHRYAVPASRRDNRPALGLDPTRRYVACIARFHPVKDHLMLLDAFARVAAVRADTDLLLVGDGPLRESLEAKARASGISDRVIFLGVRHDVPALLAACDVFALTSVSEAASLTLLEAMASAAPVVVTDVGGNPEIVRQGVDGFLVPRGDSSAAAAKLLELLADDGLARSMGAAARERVEQHFSLTDCIAKYHERYIAAARRLRAGASH
jgi:glycosyltransferase involved in cell wall biosynthesis